MAVDLVDLFDQGDLERLAERLTPLLPTSPSGEAGAERWLDTAGLAEHFSCSVRTVETWKAKGLPQAIIGGRPKFRASEVEAWLEDTGQLRWLDSGEKVNQSNPDANGAAPRTRPAPGHEE